MYVEYNVRNTSSFDIDLPLPFLNPVYEPKSTVHLLTLAFIITNQKSNSQPLHSAHHFHCTYVMYVVCFDFYCFMYYFTCISFAIRPSGRKSANKLIDIHRHAADDHNTRFASIQRRRGAQVKWFRNVSKRFC